jgi:orotate phosphoribosyltransferase
VSSPAQEILSEFSKTGAYLRGHFRLTSGLHSSEYLQCALVLQHPRLAEQFGRQLAFRIQELIGGAIVDFVSAPAIGGLIIGHEVARALDCRFIFAERDTLGKMTVRRGFELAAGQRAVVIEDVVTTGGSTREVMTALQSAGVIVLAAGSIVDRSGGEVDLGVPRVSLATLTVASYNEANCPMCRAGQPITKPGSRPT